MNEWLWDYDGYDPATEGQREALCTLGNGYVATRGAASDVDADAVHYPGTYAAGVFNRLTDDVAGRPVVNESIVNLPNWLPLRFRAVGGEWFSLASSTVLDHCVELDLRRAKLSRRSRLQDAAGRIVSITERRFVSLRDQHLMALEVTCVPENFAGRIEAEVALDGTVSNSGIARYEDLDGDHLLGVRSEELSATTIELVVRTNDSDVVVAQAARTRVRLGEGNEVCPERSTRARDRSISQRFSVEVAEGEELIVDKVVSLYTSRDDGIYSAATAAADEIDAAADFDTLLERHATSWAHAWDRCAIELSGDVGHTARVLNLHIFHLLQTISKNTTELDVGVPARGLHGEAYRGHVFWDELFIFPFLTYRVPELTRSLLRYRSRRLDRARDAARAAGYQGAMFPWQSGSDGREETQVVHLNPESGHWLPDASHLQRHINAAIAFNVWHYWQVTTDVEFMRFWGAEMLLEIARFWASAATYNHHLDRYEIKGVMGPDEYHEGYVDRDEPGLDNNAYTNVMAVWCLLRAGDALETVPPFRRSELLEKLEVTHHELDRWADISSKMRLCFHGDRILSQFEGYEDLLELDWERYRSTYGDVGRLDRILEAEGDSPNRYQLAKQADTVMLFYLLSDAELSALFDRLGYEFDDDFVRRNVAYYEQRTSHGSTLSQMVHAWLHSRLDRQRSWDLFRSALSSDINDVQGGTTKEGIHLGAMAGTVDLVQRCYTGLEARDDVLHLNPRLPAGLHRLGFSITYRRQRVQIEVTRSEVTLRTTPDHPGSRPISVDVAGHTATLDEGATLSVPLVSGPAGPGPVMPESG